QDGLENRFGRLTRDHAAHRVNSGRNVRRNAYTVDAERASCRHPVESFEFPVGPQEDVLVPDTSVLTENRKLLAWVDEIAQLTQPDQIAWCAGSAEEYDRLCQELVDAGTFRRLS